MNILSQLGTSAEIAPATPVNVKAKRQRHDLLNVIAKELTCRGEIARRCILFGIKVVKPKTQS